MVFIRFTADSSKQRLLRSMSPDRYKPTDPLVLFQGRATSYCLCYNCHMHGGSACEPAKAMSPLHRSMYLQPSRISGLQHGVQRVDNRLNNVCVRTYASGTLKTSRRHKSAPVYDGKHFPYALLATHVKMLRRRRLQRRRVHLKCDGTR